MSSYDKFAGGFQIIRALQYGGHFMWSHHKPGWWGFVLRSYRYLVYTPCTFVFFAFILVQAIIAQSGDSVYMSFIMGALIMKILNIWHKQTVAYNYISELVTSDALRLLNVNEVCIRQRATRNFTRLIGFYAYGTLIIFFTSFLTVFLMPDYELPFACWLPFDYHNPRYYWYAVGYQAIGMFFSCMSNAILDAFCCYCMFHLSELYKLLGIRFEALQHGASGEQQVIEELKELFRLHRIVKRLTAECESLVSIPIATQILLSTFILCFIGYRLTFMNIREDAGQFGVTVYLVTLMTLQIYLPCYYGNEVTISSDMLTTKVYNSNWYRWSPSTRKFLFIYMELLKRPTVIKACQFFCVGLPIFGKTINNAYSLFAVLLNMTK